MSNVQLMPFAFEEQQVRVHTDENGNPWFVAKDVCACLDLGNSRDAVSSLEDDEKGVAITDTLGGPQEVTTVSESGLYSLIFRSRKPEARRFRRWVTGEVLPAIRKTGAYAVPGAKAVRNGSGRENVTDAARRFASMGTTSPFRREPARIRDTAVYLCGIFGLESDEAEDVALCCTKLLHTQEPLDTVKEDFELTPKKLSHLWNATKRDDEERTPPHEHLRTFLLLAKYMEKRLEETREQRLQEKAYSAMADYLAVSTPFDGPKTFEVTVTPR